MLIKMTKYLKFSFEFILTLERVHENSHVNVQHDAMSSNKYHYKYLSNKIEKFMSGEVDINYPDELVPPDGSPIGSFMNIDHICESEL